ncbi:MAG: DEAD/DEAH box helicase [Phycisphaerae bacterium]|nr:DEAD/DEAH box helicase [Phycisphaerae bacterium]
MIVLHAGFSGSQLLLWGETPETPEADDAGTAKQPTQTRKEAQPKPLPYDAGADRLTAALKEAGAEFKVTRRNFETTIAWLPTVANQPVASSPLVADPPKSRSKVTLAPWSVTVLRLTAGQAVEMLCRCVGKETPAPGVVVGADLAFWVHTCQAAGAVVARQQFLPDVVIENKTCRACWKPVFAGADADLPAKLSKTMPASARALTCEAGSPPEVAPVTVVSEFIAWVVDYLVRTTVSPQPKPLKPARGAKRKHKGMVFDSVHDQWLHALRASDGNMEGDLGQLAEFAAQVREWQRPISVSSAVPFRLTFRLEEPEDDGDDSVKIRPERQPWCVRYLLQAADDPSLIIPAEDAWDAKGRKASILKRNEFNAKEYLLLSLGQASGICPRIEASLKTAIPDGYQIDATGAHEFLTEKAAALEQAGFGVMLPAWWTRKGTKLRLTTRANVKSPKMQGGSGLSLDTIIQFDWEVALGDEKLSYNELQTLAKLKAPLVNVRGQWVQMSAEEIQAALDFWKQKGTNQATVREVIQMALQATEAPGPVAFEGVTAKGWVAELLAQLDGRDAFEELPPPEEFRGTLRPYQVRGFSWLCFLRRWGLGACLADDMGLGKTIQTLALVQHDWHVGHPRPVLLICPTSVVGNWHKEAARFTPELPVLVHHGVTRAKGAAFKEKAAKHAIVISSYALLHRDFEILKGVPWAGVVLDEAQNIKNPETKQAKAARSIEADYRITLTGTPVENNVGDLWSIMEFLNPGFLGTQAEFKRTFFIPIQASRDLEATRRLKHVTGPFILRRLKTDKSIITDLPDKLEMKVFCTLTKEQASLYAAVVKEAEKSLDSAEGIQRKGMILATLSKLKQVCNHPAQFLGDNSTIDGRSGKLARLTEMLEEVIAVGDRALVFSQFSEMGGILQRHVQETFGREVLFLHGGVSKRKRDRMIERFQDDGDGPSVFILSLKAGGTGLNLTQANHVFHFDRWWNPAVENQATDRVFRIGQTKNVQVHKFLCVGTLEEKIDEMIERKKEVAEKVVGTGEGWLTELSTTELKELFALRKEAVAR